MGRIRNGRGHRQPGVLLTLGHQLQRAAGIRRIARLHRPGGDEPDFGIHGDGRTGILGVPGLRQQAVRIGHNLGWERLPGPGLIPVELRGAFETGREVPGKALPLGYVLRFDNDNDVLVGILQCRTKLPVVLESVNGHDGPVEVVEWVLVFWETFLYALRNEAIQTGETERKTHPEFHLELSKRGFGGHNQDPFAPATCDQFAYWDARFNSLAQAHVICNQNAWTWSPQRQASRCQLVRHRIICRPRSNRQVGPLGAAVRKRLSM